jgi:hypothetical protein
MFFTGSKGERVHDCKDGRVKISRDIRQYILLWAVLAGAGDCKDGRVKSKYLQDNGMLRVIAKKDSMERYSLPL